MRREPPLDVQELTYVTVNVQGSCNNLCEQRRRRPERRRVRGPQRRPTSRWLQDTFDEANAKDSAGRDDHRPGRPGLRPQDVTRAPLRNPQTLAETDANPDGFHDFLMDVPRR